MATDTNRLDRLEALAERLLEIAQHQQMQGIRHEGEIGDLKQSTADLRASTADLRASTADLVSMVGTLADQQSEISTEIRGIVSEIRGLRLESSRILDHLFNRQDGGSSEA
jgi:chromosome segregation ATPase